MKDRKPGAPGRCSAFITAAERQKMLNGERFLITLKRDDLPEEEGTPYSKAAVLPDVLAASICPEVADPTPADALKGLLPRNGSTAMDGNLPMGGNKITGLETPTADTDAANKQYVDKLAPPFKGGEFAGTIDDSSLRGLLWLNTTNGNLSGTFPADVAQYNYLIANEKCQKLISFSNDGVSAVYERFHQNGKWYPWNRTDAMNKQDTITGLTSGMVMICNSSGEITTSSVVSTSELGALNGIDTATTVQAQLNGKAPSGYGLGTGGVYNSSVDSIFNGGFYRWDTDNAQTPFANGVMLVVPRDKDTRATQLAFSNSGNTAGVMAVRSTNSTTVGEWAFINPFMTASTEYRTTEFWKGKPVYAKLVEMGKLTTEFVTVAHGAYIYYVVGVEAMAIDETNKVSFPIAYGANDNVDTVGVYVNDTTVTIHNPQLLSAYSGYVTIKYVK